MRFTALTMSATQITVRSGDRSGESTTNPAKGMRKNSRVIPSSDSRLPEKTCPASLAGGETSRRSSRAPTANIVVAPISSPSGSEVPRNTGRNWGRTEAVAMAARNPPYMAAPPSVGVGRSWTRRASGEHDRAEADRHPPDGRREQPGDEGRHQQDDEVLRHASRSGSRSRRGHDVIQPG